MSIENTTTEASITFLGTGNAIVRRCYNTCFVLEAGGGRLLVCLSDEQFNEANRPMAQNADWLLSEAFYLHRNRDIFKPYEKHHSTALDAGRRTHGATARRAQPRALPRREVRPRPPQGSLHRGSRHGIQRQRVHVR